MTHKKRALVVCPGRGTYNSAELGYLKRWHSDKSTLLDTIDAHRQVQGQTPLRELDAMPRYSLAKHTAGENAAAMIYACAAGDFADIDRDQYDIVAMTGNSMGWYLCLALSGALDAEDSIALINGMGSMMQGGVIGGQLVYPLVDEDWHVVADRESQVRRTIEEVNTLPGAQAYVSIELCGFLVVGGNEAALQALSKRLPSFDGYPMKLHNHAAFHTPLLEGISMQAQQRYGGLSFELPQVPLIDGQGQIWQPLTADTRAMQTYTLGAQVVDVYDFSGAFSVAMREFAPDCVIVLGPGPAMGGTVGRGLVSLQWQGINGKQDFVARQQNDPLVIAMGQENQREAATA